MEVKPLKFYKVPAYPEKQVVLRNPNLLKRMPQRWMGNIKISAALSSIFVLMLSGCGQKTGGYAEQTGTAGSSGVMEGIGRTEGNDRGTTAPALKEGELVAPIFLHGEGRGSFGCVSVAPPAFFSEAEAFEIVSEEAEREGIQLEAEGLRLDKVGIPVTSLFYEPQKEGKADKLKTKKGTLVLDGYDKRNGIAFEFVSKEDIVGWQSQNAGVYSSVESYEALQAVESLKEGLAGKTEGNVVALFYDPMGFDEELHKKFREEFRKISDDEKLSEDEKNAQYDEMQQKYEEEIKESRQALLREQVRDFLHWLKAQGVI